MKQNIVLMGKGTLAINIANWFKNSSKYNLQAIVPVIPEPTWTDSITAWAKTNNIAIIESGNYKDLNSLYGIEENIDLVFSVFYDKIIKDWFISKCTRIYNLHNGPLPKYRGVSPINWSLKNNEHEHGVTIHELTPGIDDGPIVGQVKYSIYPEFDEVIDVYYRASAFGWVLFEQIIPLIDKITPRVQDESQASYYSKKENHLLEERSNFTKEGSLIK